MAVDIQGVVGEELFRQLVLFRRDLHQHPELSWHETRTADQICRFLDGLNIDYRRDVASNGVVADIPGETSGSLIALRADTDALPISEETDLTFKSRNPGIMHACGHDGHTSMLLGAASLLVKEPSLPMGVRLIFQPAEETGEGAIAMIEAGVLNSVAAIFGGHVDRHFQVGSIAVTDGPVNASSDRFSIRITGKGGHAARPHETVDAVIVGSLMVMSLQTIVSREVNPAHPSVVTVGRFEAGTACNVIAGQAHLEGSIRAQDQDVRESLHQSIERMAKSIGQLHGASVEVEITPGTPVVVNRPELAQMSRQAAASVVGEPEVVQLETANMGGEDFGYYMQLVPGCYVRFGTAEKGVEQYPAHSSQFDFDERAIAVGAAYYLAIAKKAGEALKNGHDNNSKSDTA